MRIVGTNPLFLLSHCGLLQDFQAMPTTACDFFQPPSIFCSASNDVEQPGQGGGAPVMAWGQTVVRMPVQQMSRVKRLLKEWREHDAGDRIVPFKTYGEQTLAWIGYARGRGFYLLPEGDTLVRTRRGDKEVTIRGGDGNTLWLQHRDIVQVSGDKPMFFEDIARDKSPFENGHIYPDAMPESLSDLVDFSKGSPTAKRWVNINGKRVAEVTFSKAFGPCLQLCQGHSLTLVSDYGAKVFKIKGDKLVIILRNEDVIQFDDNKPVVISGLEHKPPLPFLGGYQCFVAHSPNLQSLFTKAYRNKGFDWVTATTKDNQWGVFFDGRKTFSVFSEQPMLVVKGRHNRSWTIVEDNRTWSTRNFSFDSETPQTTFFTFEQPIIQFGTEIPIEFDLPKLIGLSEKDSAQPPEPPLRPEKRKPLPYEILGVDANAPYRVIRDVYWALTKKWHPDRNESDKAHEMMKIINAAYASIRQKLGMS
ncbi:MAG: J domain-containing protein [Pseudomonadota bacterium]